MTSSVLCKKDNLKLKLLYKLLYKFILLTKNIAGHPASEFVLGLHATNTSI